MVIVHSNVKCTGIKLMMYNETGVCVASAYLYIMRNRHDRSFGLMEDVYVAPSFRGNGFGSALVKDVINIAIERGCYKLVATSRYQRNKVHGMYTSFGFVDRGKEFRMDL